MASLHDADTSAALELLAREGAASGAAEARDQLLALDDIAIDDEVVDAA